jgi:hypothetical protein
MFYNTFSVGVQCKMLVLAPLITTSAGIIPVDFFALPLFLYIEAQSVKSSW